MEKRERETEEESSKDMGGAARRYIPIEASRWMTKTRGREAPPVDASQKRGMGKIACTPVPLCIGTAGVLSGVVIHVGSCHVGAGMGAGLGSAREHGWGTQVDWAGTCRWEMADGRSGKSPTRAPPESPSRRRNGGRDAAMESETAAESH